MKVLDLLISIHTHSFLLLLTRNDLGFIILNLLSWVCVDDLVVLLLLPIVLCLESDESVLDRFHVLL